MFSELQNGFCSFPGDGGIQEGFNKNRKLIELLLRPCHSDCPDNFSAPALCQAPSLPGCFQISFLEARRSRQQVSPFQFLLISFRNEEYGTETSSSKWGWASPIFLMGRLPCGRDIPSGCQRGPLNTRKPVLCSGHESTVTLSSDVPKGSHRSPEGVEPRVRPQVDQSAGPFLHRREWQLRATGDKRGHRAIAGREDVSQTTGLSGAAGHLCAPPPKAALPSPLPALWPRGLIQPVRIKEVQCVSFSPPHWGIDSVAPSLGHLGPAVGLADASRRSFL